MSFNEKDFTGDVSYETTIGIPIYTDKGLEVYANVAEKLKYNSNEDIGTACAVFAQDKYRSWTFPDAEKVKIGIVDNGYFNSWASRFKRDTGLVDTHLEYGMHIDTKQVSANWKNKKLVSPVAVCCIPLVGQHIDPILNDKQIKSIQKVLENSDIGKNARIEVSKNITSSINLYEQLSKFEESGYKAMGTGFIVHNSDYDRQRQTGLDRYKFSCIPVFVQPNAMGEFSLDYFFSLKSELLSYNIEKMNTAVKEIQGISGCMESCLIPGEALPEFASLYDFKNNDQCAARKNIKRLAEYLAGHYQSLYIDFYVRGSEYNSKTLDFADIINAIDVQTKIESFLYEGICLGGGYVVFAYKNTQDHITAFGLAYDNHVRWSSIPVRYLEKFYHPDCTNRNFSTLQKQCVEFTDEVKVQFDSIKQADIIR